MALEKWRQQTLKKNKNLSCFEEYHLMMFLQKSLFVIPEVFIGNPVFFKTKDFWIPAFAGMTAKAISSIHLQEALIFIQY
jgi:hypothetical protein